MFKLTPTVPTVERQRYTVIQAAEAMECTREYVYQLIRDNKIPTHKYMGKTAIYVEDAVKPLPKYNRGRAKGTKNSFKRKNKKVKRGPAYRKKQKLEKENEARRENDG